MQIFTDEHSQNFTLFVYLGIYLTKLDIYPNTQARMGMHKKTCTVIRASEKKSCKKFGFYLLVSIKSSTFAAEYKKKRLHFSMLWTGGERAVGKNNFLDDAFCVGRLFFECKGTAFFWIGQIKSKKKYLFFQKFNYFPKKKVDFCNKIQFYNKLNSFDYDK